MNNLTVQTEVVKAELTTRDNGDRLRDIVAGYLGVCGWNRLNPSDSRVLDLYCFETGAWHAHPDEFVFDWVAQMKNDISEVNKARKEKPQQNTYVIYNGFTKLYKIGKSHDVNNRIETLASASGVNLKTVVVLQGDVELILHERFKNKRVKGEWFRLSTDDVSSLEAYGLTIE